MTQSSAAGGSGGDDSAAVDALVGCLRAGACVAVGDGAGAPRTLAAALPEAARRVGGGVRVFTGWWLAPPFATDPDAFADVSTYMGGYGLRDDVARGAVRYVPSRLSTLPKLVRTTIRPDLVLVSARRTPQGLAFGTEVSWMLAAVESGAGLVVEVNDLLPAATREAVLPPERIVATIEASAPPLELTPAPLDDALRAIGEHVARLVPPGASLQFGPGGVGRAVVEALTHPVRVDSGLLTDPVVDLDRRGLLLGVVAATYAVGTQELYAWLEDRAVLVRAETSHDLGRLSRTPLVAVNTALELDLTGAVNVEAVAGRTIAGVGGHPDYALAASLAPDGLSIVALPTVRGGRPSLVRRLSGPVSTARVDVDVVVTEHGHADLRGLADAERASALLRLWDGALAEPDQCIL
jgi:acyl-CoA hydrolase